MKRFRLMVVRHGNTFEANQVATQVGAKTDMALTEKGLAQAQAFADLLLEKGLRPQAIYSGSLQRQSKTANILTNTFPQAALITHTPALDEIDYGAWEGLTLEEITQRWPAEYGAWHTQGIWPNAIFGQSLEYHLSALNKWLLTVSEQVTEGGLIVAVSSNGIIRFLLQWVPGLWQSIVNEKKINDYKVGTGNYCELVFEGLTPKIESWNVKPIGVDAV